MTIQYYMDNDGAIFRAIPLQPVAMTGREYGVKFQYEKLLGIDSATYQPAWEPMHISVEEPSWGTVSILSALTMLIEDIIGSVLNIPDGEIPTPDIELELKAAEHVATFTAGFLDELRRFH